MAGSITVSSITLDSDNTFRILSNTGSSLYTLNSVNQAVTGNLSVDATGTTGIRAPSANTLVSYTAGVERMRIDSSGNVGIGTSSPAYRLDSTVSNPTRGIVAQLNNTGSSSLTGSQLTFLQNTVNWWTIGQPAATDAFAIWSGRHSGGDGTERMRIDSSGNVGIGTSSVGIFGQSSGRLLNVVASSNYAFLQLQGSSGNGGAIDFGDTSVRHAEIASLSGSALAFYTNATNSGNALTERMRIAGGGGVSIGTTSVNGLLTVNSSVITGVYSAVTGAYNAGYFATNGANAGVYGESSGYYGIYARTTISSYGGLLAYDASGTYYAILAYGGYSLYTNGSLYVNGTVYASDSRLKENVVPISNALDKIKQLNPVSFDWKADSAKGIGNNNTPLPDYGMIAQEVEQVLPDLVHEATVPPKPKEDNTKLSLEDELGSCKGIDYSKLIPFLTKAIQELKAELDATKAEVQALKTK